VLLYARSGGLLTAPGGAYEITMGLCISGRAPSPAHLQWSCRVASLCSPPSTMWRAYSGLLQTHPLRTNSISAGCIGAVGDAMAQNIERGRADAASSSWNPARTAQMFGFCSAWLGAPMSLWFRFLARKFPDGTPYKITKTLTVHMGLAAPTTNLLFFGYREALHGPRETWAERFAMRMRREFPSTTAYSNLFWIPAQTINFNFVPLHLRPLYLNSAMVVWTTYLSIAGHRRL